MLVIVAEEMQEAVQGEDPELGGFGVPRRASLTPGHAARDIYGSDLVLVRPDLHVVWRGNSLPGEAKKLAALATGH